MNLDLEAIAPILEQIIKESLEEKRYPFGFAKFRGIGNKVASGRLRNSVQVNVVSSDNGMSTLQLLIEQYASYVQSGRLPGKKGVPIQSLIDWIKDRKLQGRDKKGRFIDRRSFAFAIQNNIKKFGIRPANFYDVSLERIFEDPRVEQLILDAGYEKLDDAFDDLINSIEGI